MNYSFPTGAEQESFSTEKFLAVSCWIHVESRQERQKEMIAFIIFSARSILISLNFRFLICVSQLIIILLSAG